MNVGFRAVVSLTLLGLVPLLIEAGLSVPALSQSQGYNAVYDSHANVVVSPAFFDASMFIGTGNNQKPNLCGAIYGIISGSLLTPPQTFTPGSVIDARGVSGATALTCGAGTTPWSQDGNGHVLNVPSTILLPAGTIVIPGTWVLPNNTRLIGAGDALNDLTSGTVSPGTTLQACLPSINHCSSSFNSTDMIDLGTAPVCPVQACNNVSVENLTLDGLGQSLNGIVNTNAQTGSRVDHVSLFQILGTGLSLSGNANNSFATESRRLGWVTL